jgi:very-short-patch-repair endonuclease
VVAFSSGRSESVLESCARVIFAEHGLPEPDLQVEISVLEHTYRVDFYWWEFRTVAEADGLAKYADSGRAISQLKRDQLLRENGRKVVHFTWRQIFYEQERVIAWLREAFARNSAV